MATHELFTNRNGTVSLRELRSGEVMHSNVGPRDEARLLYIEQSDLAGRLAQPGPELVLWDAGLGAATNALAALQTARTAAGRARSLRIVSFENDLSGLALAYANRSHFPYFEGFEDAVAELLEKGQWQDENARLSWQVIHGEFHDHAAATPSPEIIYYDFYSPKTSPQFWTVPTFELIRRACGPEGGHETHFYTYSAATRVRVALLAAGFFVGYGRSTGAKIETTAASTRLSDLERPLDARWLIRLKRSEDPLPHEWDPARRDELIAQILAHPQFSELSLLPLPQSR